jgi:hypothetical protein
MSFTITNGYCTLADVKAALRIPDTVDDDRLSLAIDAASRLIETECGRYFYQDAGGPTARKFVANDPWLCEVDDIATSTGLIVQTDYAGDGSFGTTWAATDYQLEPINNRMEGENPWPTTAIRAVESLYFPVWGGIAYPKPYTQALVKITAQWGWPAVPTPIVKACIVQSVALLKADDVPFGATPFGETGVLRLREALHPTAAILVQPYRLDDLLVA